MKFFIIAILVIYIIYKLIGFAFRLMFGAAYEQQRKAQEAQKQQYTTRRRAPNSNLNIDKAPEKREKSGSEFEGGDYVDYEEVKD